MMPKNSNIKWYVLISLGVLILAGLVIVLAVISLNKSANNSLTACTYNGTSYTSGASFKSTDGCNTCSCINGSVACTSMACITTPTPTTSTTILPTSSTTPTPTISATPIAGGIKIYFGKPVNESDYATMGYVERTTDAVGLNQIPFVLNSLLSGPTAAEKTLGYNAVFSLSGVSTCSGKSYQYSVAGNTLTVKFCKNIDYTANTGNGGTFAGQSLVGNGRAYEALSDSLKINGITTVIIRQKDDTCFALDSGINTSCTH